MLYQSKNRNSMITPTYWSSLHSRGEWEGSRPQKFKGGRKHNNHPLDELDNLLMGSANNSKLLGPSKRRFDQVMTIGTDQPPKPHIRPNIDRTGSSIVFQGENSPSQSYSPGRLMNMYTGRVENASLFRNNHIAATNLQKMESPAQMNRNSYRSQFKPELKSIY